MLWRRLLPKSFRWKSLRGEAAPSLLREATQLAGAGRHDDAIELLNRCLVLQPDYVEALLTLVQVLAHQHRYEQALDACGRVLQIDPGNTSALSSLEQILAAPDIPTKAAACKWLPGEAAPSLHRGAVQLAGAGQRDKAVELLNRCLALQPDHVEALLTLVQVLAHQQRYEEALDACGRVLEIDPGNSAALASLEQILAAPDIPTKATAYKWLPGEAAPSLLGGAVQLAGAGRHDDAVELLNRCLALQPDCVEALLTLVQVLAHQHRYEEALEACGRVLEIDPGNSSALASMEQILAAPDIPTKAAACKWLPGEAAPSLLRGAVQLAGVGRHDDAVELLNRCLVLQPDYVEALLTLVQVLAHQQRYEEALDACGRVLQIDPGNNSVLASVEQILPTLVQSQHTDEALRALYRCPATKPDEVTTLLVLSKVLTRAGHYRAALGVCRRALDVHPDSVPVYDSVYEILSTPALPPEVAAHASAILPRAVEAYSSLFAPPGPEKELYDKLAAVNVVGTLSFLITRFYRELGLEPRSTPLMRFLETARERLGEVDVGTYRRMKSPLVWFETGWTRWLSGHIDEAISCFRALLENEPAMKLAKHDPFTKEAFVRAAEILGRHEERTGNTENALSIYRRIMMIDDDGVIARRMLLLLWRKRELGEAAALAERAVSSRPNLFPHLPESKHIASMQAELADHAARLGQEQKEQVRDD